MAEATAQCRSCGLMKLLEDFYRSKRFKSGRDSRCKVCGLAANKLWREANAEKVAERKRQYHVDNAEKLRAYTKKWHQENKARNAAYAREQRALNPEPERRWRRARRARDPERAQAVERAWREANAERYAETMRQGRLRRRARVLGTAVGPLDLAAIWTGFCGICSGPLDHDLGHPDHLSKSVDHIVPLARGGTHTQDNVQWAHLICNIRKGAPP